MNEESTTVEAALLVATQNLADRVQTLADAVATNNNRLDWLKAEVSRKPDDAEVKALTQINAKERKLIRNRALATAVVSAMISGLAAFWVAQEQGHERCEGNQRNISTITHYLDTLNEPTAEAAVRSLRENRNPC